MKKLLILLILLFLIILPCSFSTFAQTPPDIIHNYTVTIDPQSDGSLLMTYEFDYEATTDFPADIQYLEIGVANSDFEIISYEPQDLFAGASANKFGTSQVHLDFIKLPVKGDKFQFKFVIQQKNMLYRADDENIGFKFIPGWFDFAEIKELKVIINLKGLTVTEIEPEPEVKDTDQMIWITQNMEPDQKADAVIFICSNNSYPNLQEDTSNNSGEEYSNPFGIVLIIVVVVIIAVILGAAFCFKNDDDDDDDGYSGGSYLGGSGGISSYLGSSSRGSSSSSGSSSRGNTPSSGRSSGGGGSFGGSGRSCACVSHCACACACAGGGRVGCSERGFDITHWLINSQQQSEERDNE